jgi:hypothetical protein
MDLNYPEIIEQLKASFPEGTVQKRTDNQRAYIPNQIYTDRIETATNSQWNKEIRDSEINVPHGYIKVVVRIHIGPHWRDGVGLCTIDKSDSGDPKRLNNALERALSSAFLDAIDSWEMGWRDLAPHYRNDWGKNPGLAHLLSSTSLPVPGSDPALSNPKMSRRCIMGGCGEVLTQAEWDLLQRIPNLNVQKMTYCYPHLPNNFKRRLPADVVAKFDGKNRESR